ncbi:MAG: shikimate kinase [Clostridia bacterium]|nr:shikimate kinase [Clostridia bacterium]
MYFLIGKTLGYSHSPAIHRAFGRYDYQLHPLPPEELEDCLRSGEWEGLNVTIPYKQAVIPFLDALSDTAKRIGAVNTIVREKDGTLTGHNTDYAGFLAMAENAGIDFAGRKTVVLGSGGASQMAQTAARDRGAREIAVISRSGPDNYQNLSRHADADLLVNTTPVGTYPGIGESPVSLELFPNLQGVLDVVYNPLRTQLVLEAQKKGIPAGGGLLMLVAQAAQACELFTGRPVAADETERVYRKTRAAVQSIALIGMPGSGKSTVGRMAAQALNLPFADADAEIEKRAGCAIPDIFARQGEQAFRDMESEVLEELTRRGGIVLACGGGAVLRQSNRDALRRNALVVRLIRPLESLPTEGRPLSRGPEALREMAKVREPFYSAAADVAVTNDKTPEETVKRVLEAFREWRM